MVKITVALIALALLTGCTLSPAPMSIGLPCDVGPVILDKGASTRLTIAEQRQVNTVNDAGEVLCAWKPPKH